MPDSPVAPHCCYVDPETHARCDQPAVFSAQALTRDPYDDTHGCAAHIGPLMDREDVNLFDVSRIDR